jgi:hypothetical protein
MLITVTPATVEPVTLAEAKADIRMTHSADDAMIARQITSARQTVEMWTGVALSDAVYQQTFGNVRDCVTLPLLPATVASVTQIVDNVRVALTDFTDDMLIGGVYFARADSVVVEFQTVPGNVPAPLLTAILLLVRREYEAAPDEQHKLYEAALATAHPYRRNLGV